MISFRGQSGAELITPMMHNALSVNDIKEPMEYVYKKLSKDRNIKAFALGCSMGANILSNLLGIDKEDSILSAAVCVQAAIKKWNVLEYFKNSLNGTYDKALGKYQFDRVRSNLNIMQPYFQEKFGIDLEKKLNETAPSYIAYHQIITVPLNGYSDAY